MVVDFKFDEGDFVEMIVNDESRYMVVALMRQNGGNFYRIYDGADSELTRAEYELKLTKKAHKINKKGSVGFVNFTDGGSLLQVGD